jgi:hypothetical protein
MLSWAVPGLRDINLVKRFLDFFLDKRFIAREQDKLRRSGKKNYWVLMQVQIHPAIAILECVNDLIRNDPPYMPQPCQQYARELLILSVTASNLFKMTNNNLNNLGPPGFINRVRDRILDQRGFSHVLYELQIYAMMDSE